MSQATVLDAEFLDAANQTVKLAAEELAPYRAAAKKAADLRPAVLDRAARAGVILPDQLKVAEAMLGDHSGSVELVDALVAKVAELADQLRTAVAAQQPKTAAAQGASAPDPAAAAAAPGGAGRAPYGWWSKTSAHAVGGARDASATPARLPRR